MNSELAVSKNTMQHGFVRASGSDKVLVSSRINVITVHRHIEDPDNPSQMIYTRIAMKDYGKFTTKNPSGKELP